MKNSDILKKAKSLIALPSQWTTSLYGKDANGEYAYEIKDAVCFCMVGALRAASDYLTFDTSSPLESLLDKAVDRYSSRPDGGFGRYFWEATHFNDHDRVSHADVLAVFDLAIEMAQEQELETA